VQIALASNEPLPTDPIQLARDNWHRSGWDDSADGMALVTSITRVHQIFLARIDSILQPWGLTFARFEVLRLLAFSRQGCLPVGKVGERLQVHPASVTNAVGRLEADGLVRRRANPTDGRGVLAEITAAGQELVADCTERLNAEVFGAIPIPAERQRDVYVSLRVIRQAFGDFA
jgi:DNA-binding MarR family transcriptional regulator